MQSMRIFLQSHEHSSYGVRFSTQNYSIHKQIHSYPLYAVAGLIGDKVNLMKLEDI